MCSTLQARSKPLLFEPTVSLRTQRDDAQAWYSPGGYSFNSGKQSLLNGFAALATAMARTNECSFLNSQVLRTVLSVLSCHTMAFLLFLFSESLHSRNKAEKVTKSCLTYLLFYVVFANAAHFKN